MWGAGKRLEILLWAFLWPFLSQLRSQISTASDPGPPGPCNHGALSLGIPRTQLISAPVRPWTLRREPLGSAELPCRPQAPCTSISTRMMLHLLAKKCVCCRIHYIEPLKQICHFAQWTKHHSVHLCLGLPIFSGNLVEGMGLQVPLRGGQRAQGTRHHMVPRSQTLFLKGWGQSLRSQPDLWHGWWHALPLPYQSRSMFPHAA